MICHTLLVSALYIPTQLHKFKLATLNERKFFKGFIIWYRYTGYTKYKQIPNANVCKR